MRLLWILALACAVITAPALAGGWHVLDAVSGSPVAFGDRDEPGAERLARLRGVHSAINGAATSIREAAALLALGEVESLWDSRVGTDRCRKGACDPYGKSLRPRSRGYWQLLRSSCPEAYQLEPGPARYPVEAACALQVLRWAVKRCGGIERGLAGYTGNCDAPTAKIRARSYRTYLDVLEHGWPERLSDTFARPTPKERRDGIRLMRGLGLRESRRLNDRIAIQVEWHWHDPSSGKAPLGWHRGLTFYALPVELARKGTGVEP